MKTPKHIWIFVIVAICMVVVLCSAISWLDNEPKRKLEHLGYQQVRVDSQTPGCKDGRGYIFTATGPQGGYYNGVMCIYSDHVAVTVINKRDFN